MGIDRDHQYSDAEVKLFPVDDGTHYDRAAWAWEWLRRNPDYRLSVQTVPIFDHPIEQRNFTIIDLNEPQDFAESWGLLHMADHRSAPEDAAVFWHPDANPAVLVVAADPLYHADSLDVHSLPGRVTILRIGEQENVLISDGSRSLQLSLNRGSVLDGPVCRAT